MCYLVRAPHRSHVDIDKIVRSIVQGELPFFEESPARMVQAQGRPFLPILTSAGWLTASWTFAPPPDDPKDRTQGWRLTTANIRAEEMFTKPTYRSSASAHRCVVPVEAYFEHQHRGSVKVPYEFRYPQGSLIWLCGLWQTTADGVVRFGICTMEANRLNRWVHNALPRQPVKTTWDRVPLWLAGGGPGSVAPFLVPDDADGLVAEPTEGITGKRVENPPPPPPWDPVPVQQELF